MSLPMTICVTAEHIAKGKPEQCSKCPIALAILAAFPVLASVAVNPEWASVERVAGDDPDVLFLDAELPQAARDFIAAFDQPSEWHGPSPVHPFEFEVTWKTWAEQQEAEVAQ
jgi:hypothetical protein